MADSNKEPNKKKPPFINFKKKTNSEIICPQCNAELPKDSAFCYKCGYKLEEAENETEEADDKSDFINSPYIHELDRKSLKALKAIPGFAPLMKKFIKVFSEKQYNILNLSSNIKLSENQMPELYNMLPPICEKLGIDVPDLYLKFDVYPDAYTFGDTKPFIVITSGLLETLPMELIPTVIAHECGHIACHHTLYTTVATTLIRGTGFLANLFFDFGNIISIPLQLAFYQWSRCSELSADRAAVSYDGTPDKMIDVCMRFAGYDKDLQLTANKELFMEQANGYEEMIKNSKWDKILEFYLIANETHPFNAVRANECKKWAESDEFIKL